MGKAQKNLNSGNIIKMLRKHKEEIHRYGVKRIGLFGSFLTDNPNKKSDIDFIVVFERPTFDNYIELKFYLEKIFHKKVDLVIEDDIKPALQYIKKEALYA